MGRSDNMMLYVNEIKKRLNDFCLQEVGRTCNMLELTFQSSKNTSSISEILHIQSPFRIMCDNHLITSDRDIYIMHGEDAEKFSYFSTERNSEFDFVVNSKQQLFKNAVVSDVRISSHRDIMIEMNNALSVIVVECFNNVTEDDDESWRFFRHHSDMPHIVCYRDYITEE